jgi:hypothetical protein
MPIKQCSASSLEEYLSVCAGLVKAWSAADTGELPLWFRGQRDAAWGLIPGAYRYPDLDEDEVRSEFMLKARPLLTQAPRSDWEWYFLMQHHGLPTRLLDWTEGSLIALHFALAQATTHQDAAVWVLDPWALNDWSLGKADLVITSPDCPSEAQAAKYLSPIYENRQQPSKPIAAVPPYNSSRITAQRGSFTVHGSRKAPIESMFSKKIAKVTLPRGSALLMRRQLRTVGISEFTLFPDLDGLCRDIRACELEGC